LKITVLVEGATEKAFFPYLREFLKNRLQGSMPNLDPFPYHGRIPKGDALRSSVRHLLHARSDAVIALTDVYTGTGDFTDATDAKKKMRDWVGPELAQRFHAHAAQHDFEAWLLPFWSDIQKLAGHNRTVPPGAPEKVNHNKPPSQHIKEIFRTGSRRDNYSKPRDARRILQGKDLAVAAAACPELRSFLNTILSLCGGAPL
jgi:hypothetical protein